MRKPTQRFKKFPQRFEFTTFANASIAVAYLSLGRKTTALFEVARHAVSGCQVAAQAGNWSGGMGRAMP